MHEFRDCPKPSLSIVGSGAVHKKKKAHLRGDLVPGEPFHPKYMYNMLQRSRLNLSYKVSGRKGCGA